MKLRCIFALCVLGAGIYADELESKKAELQRQIQEIEQKQQKQSEINELERRLQELKASQSPKPTPKPTSDYAHPTTAHHAQNPYLQDFKPVTQEELDAEAKKFFGKNRSGVLIGLSAGSMGIDLKSSVKSGEGSYSMFGLRLGYQSFPGNKFLGFRLYIDAHAGIGENNTFTTEMQSLGAYNADLLLDLHIPGTYSYLGLIAGVGYGFVAYDYRYNDLLFSEKYVKLQMPTAFVNLGVAITMSAKHRIEFYAKLPTTDEYNEKFYYKTSPLITAAYQYTF